MRRLWAYLLIAFSALVISFASLPTLIKGFSSNGDHRLRRLHPDQQTLRQRTASDPRRQLPGKDSLPLQKIKIHIKNPAKWPDFFDL